eukprot:TRINITY_DN9667_c0_g1_i1.p1 TRINITY_DN9667_c0_g1~~TRINITY_DN9667_c0_g1_i1.p1  ORF type:complete len:120 (+),score=3.32 TRINITY_DN9667_c0_g1_i1:740-1099(+)
MISAIYQTEVASPSALGWVYLSGEDVALITNLLMKSRGLHINMSKTQLVNLLSQFGITIHADSALLETVAVQFARDYMFYMENMTREAVNGNICNVQDLAAMAKSRWETIARTVEHFRC